VVLIEQNCRGPLRAGVGQRKARRGGKRICGALRDPVLPGDGGKTALGERPFDGLDRRETAVAMDFERFKSIRSAMRASDDYFFAVFPVETRKDRAVTSMIRQLLARLQTNQFLGCPLRTWPFDQQRGNRPASRRGELYQMFGRKMITQRNSVRVKKVFFTQLITGNVPILQVEDAYGITPEIFTPLVQNTVYNNLVTGLTVNHSVYHIDLHPNPSSEIIHIRGGINVDELVVDTYCVPEPAAWFLLLTGGLLFCASSWRRWRK
jgi:hypothetical protein